MTNESILDELADAQHSAAYWRMWIGTAMLLSMTLRFLLPLLVGVTVSFWSAGNEFAIVWLSVTVLAWLAHVELRDVDEARRIERDWLELESDLRSRISSPTMILSAAGATPQPLLSLGRDVFRFRLDIEQREAAFITWRWMERAVRADLAVGEPHA